MPLTACIKRVASMVAEYRFTAAFRTGRRVIAAALLSGLLGLPTYATPLAPVGGRPTSSMAKASGHGSVKQSQSPAERRSGLKLTIKIIDENGLAVPSASVAIQRAGAEKPLRGETDYAGRVEFTDLEAGVYKVSIEKEGFYAKTIDEASAEPSQTLEVVLDHQQELKEVMDVRYSPPAIDPAKTATTQHLNSQELINVPYPASRDIKQSFVLMPGIVKDKDGNFHVNGARTDQTQDQIDGFNATKPDTGTLNLHVSADSVRSIESLTSSYSAEHGKGSGGLIGLITGMGDNKLRFSATNFLPSFQGGKGFNIGDWTPRATMSGPIVKSRAWFFDAGDAVYKLNIVKNLPPGGNHDSFWEMSNLSKAQVNLTQSNILSGSFLINEFRQERNGLSRFNPVGTTLNVSQSASMAWLRDQAYLSSGILIEVGAGLSHYRSDGTPRGSQPFFLTPEGMRGSFFKTSDDSSGRAQLAASAIFPTFTWKGHHQLKAGMDLDRLSVERRSDRRPTFIQREDRTLARQTTFIGAGAVDIDMIEEAGYLLDRWQVSERLLIDGGFRLDSDNVLGGISVSPRAAASILLTSAGDTKLTVGAGIFHDATNLGLVARGHDAQRLDVTYALDGRSLAMSPILVSFVAQEQALKRPRFLNVDVGIERKLPASFYLRANVTEKRGSNGFAYVNLFEPPVLGPVIGPIIGQETKAIIDPQPIAAQFRLANIGRDRYRAVEVTLRRSFKQGYEVFGSYVRSSARSNAVIDFNIDSPILSRQQGGPLPWDSPNRVITWGWAPLIKKFTISYFLEWRDGYPFSVFNQSQQLVEAPGSRRFPPYFSLDTHFERRFRFLNYNLAVRAGFNDITNRHNPNVVNSNIDSPNFLTYGSAQHRTFTARLRFLGKKK